MKTQFEFHSTKFNCSEPKEYFTNPGSYGDDFCRFLIARLNEQGVPTDAEPDQEDFGWFFNFRVGDIEHCLVTSFQPNDPAIGDCWLGWIERRAGFFASLIGGRQRDITPEAIQAIDLALRSSPDIHELSWHEPR